MFGLLLGSAAMAAAMTAAASAKRPVPPRRPAPASAVPASHASIPQSSNIEHLNDLSLQRARAGQPTDAPLAPPLKQ